MSDATEPSERSENAPKGWTRHRGARTRRTFELTLDYARERDYIGWDYFDGMSSRVRRNLPVENKWLNIAVQETIKRAPVNLRPLFLVEQRRSFKGTALFAMSNQIAHELTGAERYREEVTDLCDWLVENQAPGYDVFAGGHRHAMQQLRERRPAETPNAIPTSYGVKALLRASEFDPEYAEVARTAADFVFEDLEYTEFEEGGARIVYQPHYDGSFYTLNGGAIGARLLVDLYDHFGDDLYRERARKILDYLATTRADPGGWPYREPASASHLSMDNHHNGFIVESYLRYEQVVGDGRFADLLEESLDFYKHTLFEENGAPNWDETSAYPKDIHAATQGIILFSQAGDLAFAERILDWVLENLYAGDGQFHYQRRRWYTKRFTLMRWCEAWMAYAMATYLDARRERADGTEGSIERTDGADRTPETAPLATATDGGTERTVGFDADIGDTEDTGGT